MQKLEAVIAIKKDDNLEAVVWRNKDGHQLFFEVKEMDSDTLLEFLKRNENIGEKLSTDNFKSEYFKSN